MRISNGHDVIGYSFLYGFIWSK